ncbi:helix-turn-helix domain-containing protein [Streptomyces bottropensis]|jgi:transcriptional regulator with XRE-family HTH domain|uniref:helix-turn-helix domain-containing protein n=1 Tax=Streptomyces bottropensis TaxID=42235 RepID=UPI0036BB7421
MPNRRRAVDPTHPLGGFARRLRDLQAEAIARAGSGEAASEISIDEVAVKKKPWPTTRSAIYAALNGSRLPSPYTLCAIVTAWDPRGQDAIAEWLKLRDRVEEQLINLRPAAATVTSGRRTGAAPPRRGHAREEYDQEALQALVQRLKAEAAKKDLPVQAIAVRARLGRTTTSEVLNGRSVPSARTVAALAHALGLPADDLLRMRAAALRE